MTKLFFESVKIAGKNLPRLIFSSLPIWIPILLASGITTAIVDSFMAEGALEQSTAAMMTLVISVPVELVISLLVMAIVAIRMHDWMEGLPKNSSFHLINKYVKPLTIENLRALARMLIWSLALIVPGLYQMVKLSFVSFIVLFDPRYHQGQVDALTESGVLTKGLKRYIGLFLLLSFGVELLAEWLKKSVFEPGIFAIAVTVIMKLLFDIFTQAITFAMYKLRAKGQ